MGKACLLYTSFRQKVIEITADMLKTVLNSDREKNILVAGLGNRYITPDSLGPKVVAKILVTRHIRDTLSDKIDDSVASCLLYTSRCV